MEWLSRSREQWKYKVIGATTVHLQHEFYLLIALVLLTVSELKAQYKGSLGILGDYYYIVLTTLWLSRHLVLRWLCTWDKSSSRSPTFTGAVCHWVTSHIVAGQYFDRPNPQMVARQIGSHTVDDGRLPATLSSFFSPSILYMWQLFKVHVWYPMQALQERLFANKSSLRRSVQDRNVVVGTSVGINQAYSYWNQFWPLYGPPLQMLIAVATFAFYIWFLLLDGSQSGASYAFTINPRIGLTDMERSALTDMDTHPFGGYKKLKTVRWNELLFYMSCGGTVASIIFYGRIVLPFGDLVSGSNVLKAVRNESKVHSSQSTKTNKSRMQRETAELPWAEQYKSIVGENRFRLLCKIAVIRVFDSFFVCLVLPGTRLACRFTGHCSEGTSLMELSKILSPIGITSPLRSDMASGSQFGYTRVDQVVTFTAIVSMVVITWTILAAQAATLNRSYLGIMGYVAGGWTLVDSADSSVSGASPSQWDPRRRYKKGDLIMQNNTIFGSPAIYKATSNSLEGRPFDLYLRSTHEVFLNELGHPATSNVIVFSSAAQLCVVMFTIIVIFLFQIFGYDYGSLLWILAANLLAAYGTLSLTLPDHSEFHSLAREIAG